MAGPDEIDIGALARPQPQQARAPQGRASGQQARPPDEIDISAPVRTQPMQHAGADATPGWMEAVARGAADGISFGFADNLGLVDKEAQRKARENNRAAYLLGEVVGTVPTLVAAPLGWMTRGAGLAARAGNIARPVVAGVAQGSLAGAGHADEGDGDMAKGAARGAVMGAFLPAAAAKAQLTNALSLGTLSHVPGVGPLLMEPVRRAIDKGLSSSTSRAVSAEVAHNAPGAFERNR